MYGLFTRGQFTGLLLPWTNHRTTIHQADEPLILVSVFSDYVVFYGDAIYPPLVVLDKTKVFLAEVQYLLTDFELVVVA